MGGPGTGGLLDLPYLHLIGWALVHSVWIGALVGVALAVSLRVLGSRPAALRYGVACAALVVVGAVPFQLTLDLNGYWEGHKHYIWMVENGVRYEPGVGHVADADASDGPTAVAIRARHDESMPPWLSGPQAVRLGALLSMVGVFWLVGVAVLTVRAGRDWLALRRLRSETGPVPGAWADSLARLTREMGISVPVAIARSRRVEVPSLIGWRRPLVLLPDWLDETRPAEEIDSILAHELAHVRRHDFLVNAIQSVADVFLFYQPAYRWITERVREEREFCCDDIATSSVPGGVRAYLESLVSLEGLRPVPGVSHALALTDGDLVKRARRLADRGCAARGAHAVMDVACFLMAAALLCSPLMASRPASRLAAGALMKQDLELAVLREAADAEKRAPGEEWPEGLLPRHAKIPSR